MNVELEQEWKEYLRKKSEQEYQRYVELQENVLRQIVSVLEQNNGECDVFVLERYIKEPLDTSIALGVKRGVLEVRFSGVTLESKDLYDIEDVECFDEERAERIARRASSAFIRGYRDLQDKPCFRIIIPRESKVKLLVNLRVQKTLFDFF